MSEVRVTGSPLSSPANALLTNALAGADMRRHADYPREREIPASAGLLDTSRYRPAVVRKNQLF
jgi:hypothetical protein